MTSQSTTRASSASADWTDLDNAHTWRTRPDAPRASPDQAFQLMKLRRGDDTMIVGTVEDLGLVAEAVRDDFSLCIRREAGAGGESIAEHEGQWVGRLRRISTAELHHWGIPGLVEDAESVVSELAANAFLHGKGDRVTFRFLLTANVLAIEVDDGSPGRAHVKEADPYDESGRGLFIVSALSAQCGVSPDGTKTWCTLAIPTTARC
jgi:hypothetical protein